MTEADIRRKVKNRLFALSNLPDGKKEPEIYEASVGSVTEAVCDRTDNIQAQINEAWEFHNGASQCYVQDGYLPVTGSKLKVFVKRVMRKLLKIFWGWYIFPIYGRQTMFNGKIDNSVSCLINAGKANVELTSVLLTRLEEYEQRIDQLTKQNSAFVGSLAACNEKFDEYEKKLAAYEKKCEIYNKQLEAQAERNAALGKALEELQTSFGLSENKLTEHWEIIEKLETAEADCKREIAALKDTNAENEDRFSRESSEVRNSLSSLTLDMAAVKSESSEVRNSLSSLTSDMSTVKSELNLTYDKSLIDSDIIDYFDFEDHFRGPREMILQNQQQYIPYLQTDYVNGYVLELGFGRGELLELMRNNGIAAKGVDCYAPFVKYCSDRGFDVCCSDALTYLSGCEDDSLNGIVLLQVAEHVNTECLYQLIRTGYKKLRRGCCFIIETPNPESLSTYINFYLDGSHIKPVHYFTLEYIFRKNGYREITRMSDDFSRHPYGEGFKKAFIDNCDDLEKKDILNRMNEMMFAGRDYSIVARK